MFLPLQIPQIDEKQIMAADSLMKARATERLESFSRMTWEQRIETIGHDLLDFGLKLLLVIVIFIVGRWMIRTLVNMMNKIFERRGVDHSLRTFLRSLINITLYVVLFYLIISYLGIPTTLFVAIFAAAGLAMGMAMSGVFQNFAGGVMILLLKPFRVGDWIETQAQAGTVLDIHLFNTILRTSDNKTILLPNGSVSTSIINNYNMAKTRRIEWIVSLEYGTDFSEAQKLLMDLMKADSRVFTSPEPAVYLGNLAAGSINLTVRCWVKSADYWDVYYGINALIYKTLPEKGFSFPFPQLDVTVKKNRE